MRIAFTGKVWAIGLAFVIGGSAEAQFSAADPIVPKIPHGPISINLQSVASGLVAPNLLLPAPDGSGRKFIVDQPGQIRLIKNGALQTTPFLDISATSATPQVMALSAAYDERGLLGMAIDPQFNVVGSPGYGRLFTYTSQLASGGTADFTLPVGSPVDHHNVIASFRVSSGNPDVIDPTTRVELMRIEHPQSNHDGGMIGFGPDNLLYIAIGDGGASADQGGGHTANTGNAQDTSKLLGKILRIDPNGTNTGNARPYGIPGTNPFASSGGLKEIYAYGFRNPFRFSWDSANGKFYVADVGQNKIEELDEVVNGGNYGWRYKEGRFYFNPANQSAISDVPIVGVTPGTAGAPVAVMPTVIDPVLQYDHDEGISIIGGFVYHGTLIPSLQGKYVFGDYSTNFNNPLGRLFYADLATGDIREFILGTADLPLNKFVKGFGQDENGEIYVMTSTNSGSIKGPTGTSGEAFLLTEVPEPGTLGLLAGGLVILSRRRRV